MLNKIKLVSLQEVDFFYIDYHLNPYNWNKLVLLTILLGLLLWWISDKSCINSRVLIILIWLTLVCYWSTTYGTSWFEFGPAWNAQGMKHMFSWAFKRNNIIPHNKVLKTNSTRSITLCNHFLSGFFSLRQSIPPILTSKTAADTATE